MKMNSSVAGRRSLDANSDSAWKALAQRPQWAAASASRVRLAEENWNAAASSRTHSVTTKLTQSRDGDREPKTDKTSLHKTMQWLYYHFFTGFWKQWNNNVKHRIPNVLCYFLRRSMGRCGHRGCYKPTWITRQLTKSSSNTDTFTAGSALLQKDLYPCLLKRRMPVYFFQLGCCGSNSCEKQRTPTEMRGLSELISRWGFLGGFLPLMESLPLKDRGGVVRSDRKEKTKYSKESHRKRPQEHLCYSHLACYI